MAEHVLLVGLLLVAVVPYSVEGHNTPCNTNNDTACLLAVRDEIVRKDYWFGTDYLSRCPNGTAKMDFACMNPDLNHTTIASRMLRRDDVNTSMIDQFLRIRFNTPKGSYVACGHQFNVEPYSMNLDLDNMHTIYVDTWILGHRPTVTFNVNPGELYTLVAYDAGYIRLGGIWVNIETGDSATGQELYPYMGPVNPLYTLRNPFTFALFRQTGRIANIEGLKRAIIEDIVQNNGHYYLDSFISENRLAGPTAIGNIAINTDAYSIQHFVDMNVYNNCPYLVSKQPDVWKALQGMGYSLTSANSYTDYQGTFLTALEVDLSVTYYSPEAHFDSCCQHAMMSAMEVEVDPVDTTPIMPLYTRNQPYIKYTPIEMRMMKANAGKLYTLFLVDATDAVNNASSPNVVIHWQVVNIPGDAVERGDTVLPYMSPMPANRTEVRTFLYLLLAQTVRVDPSALWSYTGGSCDSKNALRCRFDLGSFLKHLNFKLVGLNVFRSQQDSFTRAVQYGAVDPKNVATSMAQFMNMPKPYVQAEMTEAQVCQGISGYASPCPNDCSHGSDMDPTMIMPTTTTTMSMDMGHNHGK